MQSGAPVPEGFELKVTDTFGTNGSVNTMALLHQKYWESAHWNVEWNGLVRLPNVVINTEQQIYSHFEDAIVFKDDHLSIQARGHADGTITSAEMASVWTSRSFCVEARYQIPSVDKAWPAFWQIGADWHADSSEIDFEQPITPYQGVHDVSMYLHPPSDSVVISDPRFTTQWMNMHDDKFDGSTAPHFYTTCYDDVLKKVLHWIDGQKIYEAHLEWNKSLGGTGFGPDPQTIFNLAVGGNWPGNTANVTTYTADLDLYSISYYGPK